MKKSEEDFFSSCKERKRFTTTMSNGARRLGLPRSARSASQASMGRAFLMSFEASSSLILLLIAASALQLFHFQKESPQDFFLCSDAAMLISKSGDFSQEAMASWAQEISSLSGLCLQVSSGDSPAFSTCSAPERKERFAFRLPVWDKKAKSIEILCWRA